MKRFFTLAMAAASLALAASASSPKEQMRLYPTPQGVAFQSQVRPASGVKTVTDARGITTLAPEQSLPGTLTKAQAISRGGYDEESDRPEGTVEVKCKMIYDENDFGLRGYVYAYNGEVWEAEYWDWENDFINIYLKPGTYDFLMSFSRLNEETIFGEMGDALVIIENVEVKEDMTLDFDPTTANVELQFNPTLKNGEPVDIYTMKYIDDDWNEEVVNQGNSYGMTVDKSILVDGWGEVYSLHTSTACNIEASGRPGINDLWKTEWVQNWYITPVSDKYIFVNSNVIDTEEKPFEIVVLSTRGCGEKGVITNDPSWFYPYVTAEFEESPLAAEMEGKAEYPYTMAARLVEDGASLSMYSVYSSMYDYLHTIAFCPAKDTLEGMRSEVQFGLVEATETIHYSYEEDGEIYEWDQTFDLATETPWINMADGMYIDNMGIDDSLLFSNGDGTIAERSNDALTFDMLNCKIKVGGSAPYAYLTVSALAWEGQEAQTNVGVAFYGQMNETRWLPNDYEIGTIEMVDNNPNHFAVKLHNDNFCVGLMRGELNVEADYDLSADPSTPVLTGMQCRAADGTLNDIFDLAEDGRLLLTAGAFEQEDHGYNDRGKPYWSMNYDEAEVKVEYCAHGTGAFEALEAEALTTEPQLPGIGQLYTYNLGQVSQTSESGWFDARITLTAPGGNVQTQTIAPLFCVKSLSGIASAAVEDAAPEYYNLQGMRVEQPTPGLYIVKRGNATSKQYIR